VIRKLKCKVYTFSQSCVGFFKEPGVPSDRGNYFSVILQDDKDDMEGMLIGDKIRKIDEGKLRYNVVNMWAENYKEAAKDLGPLDVITIQCPTTGARVILIVDERIPDSYKMKNLFRSYNTPWSPEFIALVESASDLKFYRKEDGSI
jgi:hypothetical protein